MDKADWEDIIVVQSKVRELITKNHQQKFITHPKTKPTMLNTFMFSPETYLVKRKFKGERISCTLVVAVNVQNNCKKCITVHPMINKSL